LDYRARGPHTVAIATEPFATSCETEVTTFVPEDRSGTMLVVLAHGFARNKEQMAGWAEHIASWGLPVVTPDLCGVLAVDHEQNALDLAAVAAHYGQGRVAYAGHSAGGLAALLAAANEMDTVAVLGLDLTDAFDLGLAAAPGVVAPVGALTGEPEFCNAWGNGLLAVDAAPSATSLHLVGADHCDFENPSDVLCDLACANGTVADDVVIDLVAGLGTAWLLGASGETPEALAWWTPGDPHLDALVDDRLVDIP
jgi:pimeloyl-ACP methyl ester carboxylesterase